MAGADVEALARSFRSRSSLLVLLVLGGLAAAVWSGTRDAGIGAPEDRRQLMVVTGEGSSVNYYAVLDRAGFAVEVDDYDDWLAEARTAAPDSEAEGVALLLELADLRGFGLVVFEGPGERDFAGLELEPEIEEIEDFAARDYAVLSVGDYAFPHRLSVDEVGDDPRIRLPGYGALEAVFRQELIGAREDPERPTVAELQFEDAIAYGRQMFERPAGFLAVIEATRLSLRAALDDGSGALTLVPLLTTGTAIPTPDGGILLVHHELEIFSDDARTLELDAGAQVQLSWIGPEQLAAGFASGEFERTPCASLAGGVLPLAELSRMAAATDGSAVAIGSPEGSTIVWRKQGPGCEWAPVAELEQGEGLTLAPMLGEDPGSRSVAVRAEQGRVLVWALADGPAGEGDRLEPTVVLEQAGREFTSVSFVDDRILAAASTRVIEGDEDTEAPAPEVRIHLLDRTRPGLYLSVPVEFFAPDREVLELITLAPPSETTGPELLIAARNLQGRAELIRLRIGDEAWTSFVAEQPVAPEFGVEGRMVSLIPEQLDAQIVLEVETLHGVSVAGRSVIHAAGDRLHPAELVRLDLASGERRELTNNSVRDYSPRHGPEGRFVTFVSRMTVNLSVRPFSVPRVLRLD